MGALAMQGYVVAAYCASLSFVRVYRLLFESSFPKQPVDVLETLV